MIFESRCQKVIPTYLRLRMGRRSVTPSRTWPIAMDFPSNLVADRTSKISTENVWKDRGPNDNRMEWNTPESHIDTSTLHTEYQSVNALSINHCLSSCDGDQQQDIKQSTKHSHSIKNKTMMIDSRKSTESHMKYKVTKLHRTHKRNERTSKFYK